MNTKLYNKTDDYNFKVIRITNYTSFTPINIKNSLVFGEILRIKRASSEIKNFEDRTELLRQELIEVGYTNKTFEKTMKKVKNKYIQ